MKTFKGAQARVYQKCFVFAATAYVLVAQWVLLQLSIKVNMISELLRGV